MSRVLLAAQPTVGHTNALRAIGVRLRSQGHAVAMATTAVRLPFASLWPEAARAAASIPLALASDGIELLHVGQSPAALWHGLRIGGKRGYDELDVAISLFTAGLSGQARKLAGHVRAWKADVVLADYLMPAAMLGAAAARVPCAALYHSALPFPVDGAPPFGSGLPADAPRDDTWVRAEARLQQLSKRFDELLGRAAAELGLPPLRRELLGQPLSESLNVLTTTREFEPGLRPLSGPVLMAGPCLPAPRRVDLTDPALQVLKPGGRRAYVSLGTVFNGQPKVFEAILDGLEGGATQVVVSAGASFEALSARPRPNAFVFRRVPQVALLEQVDVVVTHGGNNTVQETLAAGRPMVVVPFGGDQLENAARVERLGVGVAVLPSRLDAASIRRAVDVALAPASVQRARELGATLRGLDGTGLAAEAVLKLAPP
jgi:MGT family glycosyltransferase